jgi:hypothetical protein
MYDEKHSGQGLLEKFSFEPLCFSVEKGGLGEPSG